MTYFELARQIGTYECAELIRVFDDRDPAWYRLNRAAELPLPVLEAADRLRSGIPLQYITGVCEFYGDSYNVSPACLIPQPDTEHLVSLALEHLKNGPHPVLLDLCTGSGCVAISALKRAPHASGIAIDISGDALELAEENARQNGVADRITFIEADVLKDPRMAEWIRGADVIASNPPYIKTEIIPTLPPDVRMEPHIALDGGPAGLDFYSRFILDYTAFMKAKAVMILEIGYDQSEQVAAIGNKAGLECHFCRDYAGILRDAVIKAPTGQ